MNSIETSRSTVNVTPIKAFSDNYIWAMTNKKTNSVKAALVDPGDATVCIDFIESHQLILSAILITHHHSDHTGGIEKLITYCQQKQWPLTVYGPANEKIPHCDVKLTENNHVNLSELNINFRILDLPGHTAGHIAYVENSCDEPILFCGDTLFSGGCGRLFEGTAEQMLNSLTKLANLPENTKVYCTHEYTQANLKFAVTVEPENEDLIKYSDRVDQLRSKAMATIPTSIKVEKQINPFLRSHEQAVQKSAMQFDSSTQADTLETFTTIRRWKDQF
jgi:hydroxyacylglutathione hydrolase